jgi:hypothetical protein
VPGLSAQQALQLVRIQSMFTNDCAVQEQDRDVESMAALQDWIAIDVDYVDWWEWKCTSERVQLPQHLIAELTVVAMDDRQT